MDYPNQVSEQFQENSLFNSFEPTSNHAYLQMISINSYSKTCLKRSLKNMTKIGFQDSNCLMQVKSIAECSPLGAFCNTFDLH